MKPHTLILTAGFALCAGAYLMPLADAVPQCGNVLVGALMALAVIGVMGMRKARAWRVEDWA